MLLRSSSRSESDPAVLLPRLSPPPLLDFRTCFLLAAEAFLAAAVELAPPPPEDAAAAAAALDRLVDFDVDEVLGALFSSSSSSRLLDFSLCWGFLRRFTGKGTRKG